jgi:hypothetical protein
MAKQSKVLHPLTPVRNLFLGFFKPSNGITFNLGKRGRLVQDEAVDVISSPPHLLPKPLIMALQNTCSSSDAVIITALDTLPFCCHEDLLTMSRPQLVTAALSLNAKLPAALHIDVNPSRPDSFIRNSIEVIVGLKRSVPPAPKAVKSHSIDLDDVATPSPPTSPLSNRNKSYDLASPRLARLTEENEDEEESIVIERPFKKRKFSNATTLMRAQSHQGSPTRSRRRGKGKSVQRSQSLALPNNNVDTTFVTTTRPRYRFRAKAKVMDVADSDADTSTSRQFLDPRVSTTTSTSATSVAPLPSVGSIPSLKAKHADEAGSSFGIGRMGLGESDMDVSSD